MIGWNIRPATAEDAPAIADVHQTARREAYAGLLPAGAVDGRGLAERTAVWRARLADPPAHGLSAIIVGVLGEGIVGFVAAGPQRAPELVTLGLQGEVQALYVLARAQRAGLGRALLAVARRSLAASGFAGTGLWTFADNLRARRFYARAGGREFGITRPVAFAEGSLDEVAYGWDPP